MKLEVGRVDKSMQKIQSVLASIEGGLEVSTLGRRIRVS